MYLNDQNNFLIILFLSNIIAIHTEQIFNILDYTRDIIAKLPEVAILTRAFSAFLIRNQIKSTPKVQTLFNSPNIL